MHSPPHAYAPDQMPTLTQYLNGEPPLNIKPTVVDYEPGTMFKYANAGFSALQIMAEDMSGKPYAVFARQVLFDPLNMKYSTFEQPLPREKELYSAAGHKTNGMVNEIKRYAYPSETAGGLWTTAEEYARFIIEIQRALKGESNRIMSEELARQMTSPQEAKEYGLGVFMTYTDSVTYFSHIGDARGFVAGFVAHPTAGYGTVVTTNSNNGMALINEIVSGVAKVYGWQTLLPPTHARYKLEDTVKAQYVGRYRVGFDDVGTVSEKGGNLFCQTAEMGESRLYPISRDTMLFKERLEQLVFEWDADGTVSTCIIISGAGTGRNETKAIKMAVGEMTPMERLLAGDVDVAIAAYKVFKKDFPDDPSVAEARFNNLGYGFLNQNKIAEALAVFQLNIDLYPTSGNCWDSMGEALVAAGRKGEALNHYRKALELDPSNDNATRWIEKLTSGN
ncbi:MAG TPA: serine hydrolase, partial [Desulfobacterales bacterium]|nr:serine hydrolase [Desulfobacterales bacterium]